MTNKFRETTKYLFMMRQNSIKVLIINLRKETQCPVQQVHFSYHQEWKWRKNSKCQNQFVLKVSERKVVDC